MTQYRHLGKTGLQVSELCLGVMTFGREADEPTSRAWPVPPRHDRS